MLQMVEILEQIDQQGRRGFNKGGAYLKLSEMYKETIKFLKPSFFTVLWEDNIYANKIIPDTKFYNGNFSDGHPTPFEHLKYLKTVFPKHTFKSSTLDTVTNAENFLRNFLKEKSKKQFAIYELSSEELKQIKERTKIKQSLNLQKI